MIKVFPSKPGFNHHWTVVIDFSANGLEKSEAEHDSYEEALHAIKSFLNEEVEY